jgi:tetratricopeptide (TPR) repeat protein
MRLAAILIVIPILAHAQSGEQLFQERRYDEARTAFQARLTKDKADAGAVYYMGRIAMAQNKAGDAVDWFEKAVALRDTSALYHDWLGAALGVVTETANKFRQPFLVRRVKTEFERAVELDPKMIGARFDLLDFYTFAPSIMGGGMDKAKEQAAEIAMLSVLDGHVAMAKIARREKNKVQEEREDVAAIEAAPDSAVGYSRLIGFYFEQSRWDDVFATCDRLMQHKPDEMPVHITWAAAAAISGKYLERGEREAKFYLASAKDAMPGNLVAAHWRLGQIYAATGRKELARSEYNEALRIYPQNQAVKKSLEALK